ncbi:hypothetical protein [Labilibacter marinus]|uniref:hypothetical protein n=1 Tax=Labilibacter marinus TaxID=1477105 RepID=UPI00082AD2F2|nr:hypothetical protein [Labilibacter marinus]
MKPTNSFAARVENIFTYINSVNPYFLTVLIISAHYLGFTLTSNEEIYFPLAKHFADPSWLSHSFVVKEWPGTRVLYQYIAGFMLKYMSFENVAFYGRLIIFLISAYPLTKLFKLFKFSNISFLILLEIFLISQSWIGGEYIFENFEPKSFAYIFVLFSLHLLVKGKYWQSIALASLASYFHILVGGWYTAFALTYILAYEKKFILPIKLGIMYVVIVSPFVYYLSQHIFESGSLINGVNIDWVYTFYRNPHHTAPLSRPDALKVVWPSIIQMIVMMIFIISVMRKNKGLYTNKLYIMNLVLFTMIWIALFTSVINTSGSFLKYYLFRINTVGALMFYIYLFWWIKRYHPKFARKATYFAFFLLFIPSLIGRTTGNIKRGFLREPNPNYIELVDYIKKNTKQSDILIEHCKMPLSLLRRTERETFVNFKMVPGGGEKIYEWYIRMELLNEFRENVNTLIDIKSEYPIHYLISKEKLNQDYLTLKHSNPEYFLYKIN